MDHETVSLLGTLADQFYGGNKSLAIRAAVESLAAQSGHPGWVVAGFTPIEIESRTACHCCSTEFESGATLFKPVFERGVSPKAFTELPEGKWLDCAMCAGGHL